MFSYGSFRWSEANERSRDVHFNREARMAWKFVCKVYLMLALGFHIDHLFCESHRLTCSFQSRVPALGFVKWRITYFAFDGL